MLDKLDEMPLPVLLAFGVTLALVFIVRHFGLAQGRSAPLEQTAAAAQVAAVIVDPTALNRASAAVESLTATLSETNAIARDAARANGLLAEELDRVREEMRISREVTRR